MSRQLESEKSTREPAVSFVGTDHRSSAKLVSTDLLSLYEALTIEIASSAQEIIHISYAVSDLKGLPYRRHLRTVE